VNKRTGTLWVLEDPIPLQRRWYSHWDRDGALPNFGDDVDVAVDWGVDRVRTVIVRTLDEVFYWAGERPLDFVDEDLREWPPSAGQREEMDERYRAELADFEEAAASRATYVQARAEWFAANAVGLVAAEPVHRTFALWRSDESGIELEEFDHAGAICGARSTVGRPQLGFGADVEALAAASGRSAQDPWVMNVCAALARDRSGWSKGRRQVLLVQRGEGTMYHVSAVTNRDSIGRHGLDWRHMGATAGVAGSPEPEVAGIFLCASDFDARFFTDMARTPSDIWTVRVDGFWLEGDPNANGGDNWMLVTEPVAPERLELLETDVQPRRFG
jgi:hypothetical protein